MHNAYCKRRPKCKFNVSCSHSYSNESIKIIVDILD